MNGTLSVPKCALTTVFLASEVKNDHAHVTTFSFEQISRYKIFTNSKFKPQFSVYFVAFDGEESGCRGSQEFIYSHIKPHLEATGAQAQGAYILDTLLNYDKRPGSQGFSKVCYLPFVFVNRRKPRASTL